MPKLEQILARVSAHTMLRLVVKKHSHLLPLSDQTGCGYRPHLSVIMDHLALGSTTQVLGLVMTMSACLLHGRQRGAARGSPKILMFLFIMKTTEPLWSDCVWT
jgi:hypothetical protein